MQEDIWTLRDVRVVLEAVIKVERELSNTVARATWEAMESLEGAVADLSAVPAPRKHTPAEMDVTLGRLRRTGEVCLSAA